MPKWPSIDLMLKFFSKSTLNLADVPVSHEPYMQEQEQGQEASFSNISNNLSKTSAYKEHVRSIDDSLFIKLILSIWDPEGHNGLLVKVVSHNEGAYNYCVTLQLDEDEDQMVVRVPFEGTRETWTDDHAFEFRTEVTNQKYLCNKTKIPVPSVYEWDDGFDNIIGAPFIIMPKIYGSDAFNNLWFEEDMWDWMDNGKVIIRGAGSPSPELEGKRLQFLQDLAKLMADLQNHEFDKIGALHIEDRWDAAPPTVGHYFQHSLDGSLIKTGPFSSTAEYLEHKKQEIYERDISYAKDEEEAWEAQGMQKIGAIICDALPRSVNKPITDAAYETTPETFVLAHPDLDLQNIFVNEHGKITGIIDWNGLRTVPRWAGFASLPLFLRKDFDEAYECRQEHSAKYSLMPWHLEPYKKAYHRYLKEALDPEGTGSYNDAAWTLESGATCAAVEALESVWYRNATIQRLLKELPQLRGLDLPGLRVRFGLPGGWPDAEAVVKKAFTSLFAHS
ncbi:hypothetical protein PMIN06_003629 [Paraphaeosphaeria minitans]|uniref:Aminoglycoside phosphotransferase domain-containing protein n=1 Tax=Paraphaeosphaeria minitans TaxID=565426 RepID=A0A9P6G9E5_9PLEO|nr:hypothetical protein PMIN01_10999 [Paraphaeosphaeria minitans]